MFGGCGIHLGCWLVIIVFTVYFVFGGCLLFAYVVVCWFVILMLWVG